jgi:hypothetical protein
MDYGSMNVDGSKLHSLFLLPPETHPLIDYQSHHNDDDDDEYQGCTNHAQKV